MSWVISCTYGVSDKRIIKRICLTECCWRMKDVLESVGLVLGYTMSVEKNTNNEKKINNLNTMKFLYMTLW